MVAHSARLNVYGLPSSRGLQNVTAVSRFSNLFSISPRYCTELEAPNISDDTNFERKGTLFKPNIPPES